MGNNKCYSLADKPCSLLTGSCNHTFSIAQALPVQPGTRSPRGRAVPPVSGYQNLLLPCQLLSPTSRADAAAVFLLLFCEIQAVEYGEVGGKERKKTEIK